MNKKLYILIIILLIAFSSWYFLKTTNLPQLVKQVEKIPINKLRIPSVTLNVGKETDKIIFTARSTGNVFMPESSYWKPTGSWEFYRFVNGGWDRIQLLSACSASCDTVCETGPVYCVAGGPSPICRLASPEEKFVWDMRHIDYRNITCSDNKNYQCTYFKNADPGRYKAKFIYKIDCSEGELFDDNPLMIEQEFSI